jgi:hypothetical protein
VLSTQKARYFPQSKQYEKQRADIRRMSALTRQLLAVGLYLFTQRPEEIFRHWARVCGFERIHGPNKPLSISTAQKDNEHASFRRHHRQSVLTAEHAVMVAGLGRMVHRLGPDANSRRHLDICNAANVFWLKVFDSAF